MPLTYDPTGLPADVLRATSRSWPDYEALRLSKDAQKRVPEIAPRPARGRVVRRPRPSRRRHRRAGPGRARRPVSARRRRAAPWASSWAGSTPRFGVWAPTAQDVDLLVQPAGGTEQRVQMARQDDGVVDAERPPVLARRDVPLRRAGLRARRRQGGAATSSPTRTRSRSPPTRTRSVVADLDDPALTPAGWSTGCPSRSSRSRRTATSTSCTSATSRSATPPCRQAARHLPRLHRAGLRRHAAPARPGAGRPEHRAPAADASTSPPIEERRDQQATPHVRPARPSPPDSDRAAGVRRRGRRDRTASTGATTRCTTRRRRARTRPTRTGRRGPRSSAQMVQGLNGAGLRVVMDVVYNHTAAAGQDADVGARQGRPRLLPAAVGRRRAGDLDLLRQHRVRAPDDGRS